MSSRLVVVGLVGLGLFTIIATSACDPLPDECDESRCDGNIAVECVTAVEYHSKEVESTCPSDTKCFVSKTSVGFGRDTFCGRLQADGSSCSPVGATSCNGAALRECVGGKDGTSYWLDVSCSELKYSSSSTCVASKDGTSAFCS